MRWTLHLRGSGDCKSCAVEIEGQLPAYYVRKGVFYERYAYTESGARAFYYPAEIDDLRKAVFKARLKHDYSFTVKRRASDDD